MPHKSRFKIILQLLGLVKPLAPLMLFTVTMGTIGFISGIFISIVGGYALLNALGMHTPFSTPSLALVVLGLALTLSVSKYLEQLSGHYIAFKLLAQIRDQVFTTLRKLAPAKLEGRDKGNLITIITSDIELIEVFYAHTIAPVAIALLCTAIMTFFFYTIHPMLAAIALLAYITVGFILPMINGKLGKKTGRLYRNGFGDFNSYLLESIRGLKELIQFGQGDSRKASISEKSMRLSQQNKRMKEREGLNSAITDLTIMTFGLLMLSASISLSRAGAISSVGVIASTIAMLGSFGPTVALSALSNDLTQTLASGERVLHLINEKPLVNDITQGVTYNKKAFSGIECENIHFSYNQEPILEGVHLTIPPNSITGIHGVSGSGKSTLLKLLMRFWSVDSGDIYYKHGSKTSIEQTNTKTLRQLVSYVTQDTYLFNDTIKENIRLAKPDASLEDVMKAAKNASIHDFISQLPQGYHTQVGELGGTLSGGERQRIGLARAFLHDAPIMLLDEPTSNVDSLNEGIILKAIKESCKHKSVVLVSHRKSTLSISDLHFHLKRGRVS